MKLENQNSVMNPVNQMITEVVSKHSQLSGCRAIALIGSRARGTNESRSGVDMMSIFFSLPDLESRKETIHALEDKGTQGFMSDYPVMMNAFIKGGLPFNIWCIRQDIMCERVAAVEKLRRPDNSMLIASLQESKILWDTQNQLGIWKDKITPIPEQYKQEVIPQVFAQATSVIEDLVGEQKSRNTFYVQHEFLLCLERIYELLFLLNGRYLTLTHQMTTILSHLELLPDAFQSKVDTFLSTPNSRQGLRLKWRLLAELIKSTGQFIEDNGKYDLERGWNQMRKAVPFLFY